jgi:hypothetical protein
MKNLSLMLCLIAFTQLNACSTHPSKPNAPNIHVTYAEDFRIRFSGKGAGAGMMLMGSMGPMGIAIGVAIDEGIAKDIRTALENSNERVDSLVKRSLLRGWNKHCVQARSLAALCQTRNDIAVTIHSLSFVSKGDDVTPMYAISLMAQDQRYDVPTESIFEEGEMPTALLDTVKKDGAESAALLQQYFDKSFDLLMEVMVE